MRAILSVVDNNPEAVVKVGLLCNFSCNSHQVSQECLAKQTSPLTHEHEACQQPTNKNRLREHEGQGQDEDEEVDDDEYQEETKREGKIIIEETEETLCYSSLVRARSTL